jgi:hypothetical protein
MFPLHSLAARLTDEQLKKGIDFGPERAENHRRLVWSCFQDYRLGDRTASPGWIDDPSGAFSFQSPDPDLRSRIVPIEPMKDVLLFHLSVVLVDQSLHRIQDHRLIEVWPSTRIEDRDLYSEIALHQRVKFLALPLKVAQVIAGLVGLDECGPSI